MCAGGLSRYIDKLLTAVIYPISLEFPRGRRMAENTTSSAAEKAIADRVRALSDEIAIMLIGLSAQNPQLATTLAGLATEALNGSIGKTIDPNSDNVVPLHDEKPHFDRFEKVESVDDFIVAIARESGATMSIQQIVDFLEESGIEINRPSLIVKLHRMVKRGQLVHTSNGHFQFPAGGPGSSRRSGG